MAFFRFLLRQLANHGKMLVGSTLTNRKENAMPPSGFSQKAVKGALIFVQGCYEDLLEEVRSGKHQSYEEGIKYEIEQIERALLKLHVDADGNLVER